MFFINNKYHNFRVRILIFSFIFAFLNSCTYQKCKVEGIILFHRSNKYLNDKDNIESTSTDLRLIVKEEIISSGAVIDTIEDLDLKVRENKSLLKEDFYKNLTLKTISSDAVTIDYKHRDKALRAKIINNLMDNYLKNEFQKYERAKFLEGKELRTVYLENLKTFQEARARLSPKEINRNRMSEEDRQYLIKLEDKSKKSYEKYRAIVPPFVLNQPRYRPKLELIRSARYPCNQ